MQPYRHRSLHQRLSRSPACLHAAPDCSQHMSQVSLHVFLSSCPFHSANDLHIAATTTQISSKRDLDFLIRRCRILFEEVFRCQNHSRRAISALEGMLFLKGVLDRMVATQSLYRRDFTSLSKRC